MKTFNLPDLGEGLPDAEVVRWLVDVGTDLEVDQPMVEMETAKAVVEVPSPFKGKLAKVYGQAGDVILTGAPLCDFAVDGEAIPEATETPAEETPAEAPKAAAPDSATAGNAEVFLLPDLGEGLPDAEIVKWLVAEGDTVAVDQPMVEMETAKAVVEVPSPFAGVISKFHGQAGDVIQTGAPLVSFGGDSGGETAQEEPAKEEGGRADSGTVVGAVVVGNQVTQEASSSTASGAKVSPVVKALARKLKVDLANVTATGKDGAITQDDVKKAAASGATQGSTTAAPAAAESTGRATNNPLNFRASPAVRALARRLDVDLADCQASGKKNTITRKDVENAAGAPKSSASRPAPAPVPASATGKTEAVRGARRAMAMAMTESHNNVVPVTLMDDANISKWRKGEDATMRLVRAIVAGVRAEPALNCWFDGAKMERILHAEVHVGMAVDTPEGLYVPVIKDADRRNAADMREALDEIREKIKTKSIKPQDLSGATISLSNFGTIAGRYGTPIVVPPMVAILGAGRYRDEMKMTDKGIEMQRHVPLSLSFDHRACTGGEAARCLAGIIRDLELPN